MPGDSICGTEPDTDGTTIYRLFSPGLTDYLRQHPVSPDIQVASIAIAKGLLSHLLNQLSGSVPGERATAARQWSFAEPYLLRHALQHAVFADRPQWVAGDPEFLVHADRSLIEPFLENIRPRAAATCGSL